MWARARRASGSGSTRCCPTPTSPQIVIVTKDLEARERVKARLERAIADGALPEARARVDRFVFGPPVGFPVQFRVVGPDPLKVREIAEQVRQVMAANPKIIDPHLDWSEQVKSIRLEVDQDRARALGLTPAGRRADAADAALGLHRHAISRRHRAASTWSRAPSPSERLELDRLPSLDHRHPQRRRRCRSRRSRGSTTSTRSRSCGGATATWC